MSELANRSEVLQVRVTRSVAWLTMTRQQALNAFDTRLQEDMRLAIDVATADPAIRCVVITGVGRAFSSGADLSLDDLSPDRRLAPRTEEELRLRYNPIIRGIRTMPKPVVAAVNGTAAGMGCALALACDHVIAADTASFVLAFTRVGLTLDAGASLLLGARVGFGRATRMAMLAESVDAQTALGWGMIDAITTADDFTTDVERVADRLATGPTRAYAAIKHSLNVALLPHLDDAFESEVQGQTALVDSADFRSGVAAFTARTHPTFTGS